ncbi:hypothetical protein, partial [Mycolicibacterium moriokaense]
TQNTGTRDRNVPLAITTLLNQKGCCIHPLKPPRALPPSLQNQRNGAGNLTPMPLPSFRLDT